MKHLNNNEKTFEIGANNMRVTTNIKVGLNLKFDYKMQFLFLEKSETSGIEESHDMSF